MASDPLDVALQVGRILDALGVPYALGGALASAVLGEPRATEDIDVVAGLATGTTGGVFRRTVISTVPLRNPRGTTRGSMTFSAMLARRRARIAWRS